MIKTLLKVFIRKVMGNLVHRGVKKKYPQVNFAQLENYIPQYLERYRGVFESHKNPPESIGRKGTHFLQMSYQRSRFLINGFIQSINFENPHLAFLAVRAHLETTGAVSYLYKSLDKFYSNEISLEEMDKRLLKLSLGGKAFPRRNQPDRTDPINVMTQIDSVDHFLKKMGINKQRPFREEYDFLSEFCHPNLLGLTLGFELPSSPGTVFYPKELKQSEEDLNVLINSISISCDLFLHLYDKCQELILNNEKIKGLH